MNWAHIFKKPNGEVIAIDTEALGEVAINDDIGEPLFDGQPVAGVIVQAFLHRNGGRRLHLAGEDVIFASNDDSAR